MDNLTKPSKISDIKRAWHTVDVQDKTLGRIASTISVLLMGKSKPYFVRHLDVGDYVVVVNAKEVKVTGKKETLKKYYNASGYPGGLRVEALGDLRKRKPEEIIRHAVKGMLPQNKLRDRMMTRLFVFAGEEHGYSDKLKTQMSKLKTTAKN